jgi:hypothetical protein
MIKQTDYSEFFMKIQRGKQRRAGRFCFYGTDGIGKTFFASAMKRLAEKIIATEQSKKVLILDVALDVAKIELAESTYVDIGKTTTSLINDEDIKKEFNTIVIDSFDWLVTKIENHVCTKGAKNSISDFEYGTGYTKVFEAVCHYLETLDEAIEAGFNVIILAHSKKTQVEDPISPSRLRYDLAIHWKSANRLKEWCDLVGFMYLKSEFREEELGFNKTITRSKGKDRRMISFCENANWEAKSRIPIKQEIDLDYETFASELAKVS